MISRDLEQELSRAVRAEQVINNELYQEAFISFRAQLMDSFEKTKFKQSEEREEIWRKMQTVKYVEDYLAQVINTGKLAKESLASRAAKVVGLK